jgi:hypothetical protein
METLERAQLVADIFIRDPGVLNVELFGSVAKHGKGHDVDIVLVSDESISDRFMSYIKAAGSLYSGRGGSRGLKARMEHLAAFKLRRRQAAVHALGQNFRQLLAQACQVIRPEKIDLFVLPSDWKTNPNVGRRYSQGDPGFLMRIAPEAIPIA